MTLYVYDTAHDMTLQASPSYCRLSFDCVAKRLCWIWRQVANQKIAICDGPFLTPHLHGGQSMWDNNCESEHCMMAVTEHCERSLFSAACALYGYLFWCERCVFFFGFVLLLACVFLHIFNCLVPWSMIFYSADHFLNAAHEVISATEQKGPGLRD